MKGQKKIIVMLVSVAVGMILCLIGCWVKINMGNPYLFDSGKWQLDEMEKDLTVLVPEDLPLNGLTVKSMSANIHLDTIQAESANIGTGSGNIELTNCTITDIVWIYTTSGWVDAQLAEHLETFIWDTTSGTLQITAPKVKNFSACSVSGAVSLSVKEEPEALDIKTTSGSIDLTLPKGASFTLDYDSTRGC